MSEQEKHIIDKLVAGDKGAYQYLYAHYYAKLGAYAMRYCSDQEDAEEIVQGIIAKLWETKEKLGQVTHLQAYLYRMVHNACLNKLEKQKVRDQYASDAELELRTIALEDDSIIDDELKQKIYAQIELLPEQSRLVFKMKHLQGMRYKEIAEELNIGERTVETHLKRAMQSLKTRLKDILPVLICSFPVLSQLF